MKCKCRAGIAIIQSVTEKVVTRDLILRDVNSDVFFFEFKDFYFSNSAKMTEFCKFDLKFATVSQGLIICSTIKPTKRCLVRTAFSVIIDQQIMIKGHEKVHCLISSTFIYTFAAAAFTSWKH